MQIEWSLRIVQNMLVVQNKEKAPFLMIVACSHVLYVLNSECDTEIDQMVKMLCSVVEQQAVVQTFLVDLVTRLVPHQC